MKEDEGGGRRRLEWRRRLGAFGDGDSVGLGVTVMKLKTAGVRMCCRFCYFDATRCWTWSTCVI